MDGVALGHKWACTVGTKVEQEALKDALGIGEKEDLPQPHRCPHRPAAVYPTPSLLRKL